MSALSRLVASAAARLGAGHHLRRRARPFAGHDARWHRSFSATDGGDGEDDDADTAGDGDDTGEDAPSIEASDEGADDDAGDDDGEANPASEKAVSFQTEDIKDTAEDGEEIQLVAVVPDDPNVYDAQEKKGWLFDLTEQGHTLDWNPNIRNAHLSDRAKTQMYVMHRKDPAQWDVPALAERYKIRQQRVMAILALSRDLDDLKERLGRIHVGRRGDGSPVFANELDCVGAMTVLLKEALLPNLVQTLEGGPALVHCGPFANIAHGCNSVLATQVGMATSDYAVTEAGFGADLGAEMRSRGGVALLASLLADESAEVQQSALLVLSNLVSDAVDPDSAATKRSLLQCGAAKSLLSAVYATDAYILMLACGCLQVRAPPRAPSRLRGVPPHTR